MEEQYLLDTSATIEEYIGYKFGKAGIGVIEWNMLDKRKYCPLTMSISFGMRLVFYPFSVVRTRLQIQKGLTRYRGTFDAVSTIAQQEGRRGLYAGFWINNVHLLTTLAYVSSYENVRYSLNHVEVRPWMKALFAGGVAALVSETILVPTDIISQYLMMVGKVTGKMQKVPDLKPLGITAIDTSSRYRMVSKVVRAINREYGFFGFYKGFWISVGVYVPSSAIWWFSYDIYCDMCSRVLPRSVPRLGVMAFCGPMAGITAALCTNPTDIIRARMQVERTSFLATARLLWQEEHLRVFRKGLTARVTQSVAYSFLLVLGYESVKKLSLKEEYRDSIKW